MRRLWWYVRHRRQLHELIAAAVERSDTAIDMHPLQCRNGGCEINEWRALRSHHRLGRALVDLGVDHVWKYHV